MMNGLALFLYLTVQRQFSEHLPSSICYCISCGHLSIRVCLFSMSHFYPFNLMKTKLFITTLMVLGVSFSTEAQFLDRLKKKVIEKSQEVIIDKTADKAAEKTAESMDRLLNPDLGDLMKTTGKIMDTSLLPESYRFDYRYSLNVKSNEGEVLMDYLVSEDDPYMGTQINSGPGVTMIFDEQNKAMVTIVGETVIATETPELDAADEDFSDYDNLIITELPNRSFLGYDCIGRQLENDEYRMKVYIAPDVTSGFSKMFKGKRTNLPRGLQAFSDKYENGIMMYADIVDKSKENHNATIECVGFKKEKTEIKTR